MPRLAVYAIVSLWVGGLEACGRIGFVDYGDISVDGSANDAVGTDPDARLSSTPCSAILSMTPTAPSGIYAVDADGAGPIAPFDVFCDMLTSGGGWTVFHPDQIGTLPIDPSTIRADEQHAIIYLLKNDATQYFTLVEQLPVYAGTSLGLTQTSTALSISFAPNIVMGSVNGFRTNGTDLSFINCDTNPSSYFSFFRTGTTAPGDYDFALTQMWRQTRLPLGVTIPSGYFGADTAFFGGCGAHTDNLQWTASDGLVSAALGVR